MSSYRFEGREPWVHASAYIHPSAVLLGDVHIEAACYVGPLASLRADFGRIVLRAGSNVQDGCVLHGVAGRDTVVEEDGHLGHGAVVHGCLVRCGALIGMRAVVMDGADIGSYAVVAAGAVVPAGMQVPARTLVTGVPAKIRRALTERDIQAKKDATQAYRELAARCHSGVQCLPVPLD